MGIPIKNIRKILIVLFLLIGIGGILTSIFVIFLTAFGIGWGGGEATLLEIIWTWKGLLLLTGYSTLAGYGLIKNKKIGVLLGFVTSICFIAYIIFNFGISLKYGGGIKFGEVIATLLILTLIGLIIIGLYKIMKSVGDLSKIQYLIGGILTSFVIISFVFMFN